jgi:hypothetical protein
VTEAVIVALDDSSATALEFGLGGRARFSIHEFVQGPSEHLVDRIAEHRRQGRVDERGAVIGIERPDALGDQLHDSAIALPVSVRRSVPPTVFTASGPGTTVASPAAAAADIRVGP